MGCYAELTVLLKILTFKKECKNFGQGLAYKKVHSKSEVISFKKILTSMKINSYLSWLHLKLRRRDREIHCKRCRYTNITKHSNVHKRTLHSDYYNTIFFHNFKWKLRICKNQIWLFLQSGLWSTWALRGYQNFHIPSETARCLPSFFVNTDSNLKLNPEILVQSYLRKHYERKRILVTLYTWTSSQSWREDLYSAQVCDGADEISRNED